MAASPAQSLPEPAPPPGPRSGRHGHLWSLPDGKGLHAPAGIMVAEGGTGRLCCHLCGRWFIALGVHVRVHGHTAGSYRQAMGLPAAQALVAAGHLAQATTRSVAGRAAAARAGTGRAGGRPCGYRSEGWTFAVAGGEAGYAEWVQRLLRHATHAVILPA